MNTLINKMRADFDLLAEHRLSTGEWSEQDKHEIGLAIKAAIDSDEKPVIAMWGRWLADLAAWITAWRLVCAPIDELIRLRVAQDQAVKGKGK